jgi:hypothetical protein
LTSPDSNSIRAPSKVNPWNSGNPVIKTAYCSFMEGTSAGHAKKNFYFFTNMPYLSLLSITF